MSAKEQWAGEVVCLTGCRLLCAGFSSVFLQATRAGVTAGQPAVPTAAPVVHPGAVAPLAVPPGHSECFAQCRRGGCGTTRGRVRFRAPAVAVGLSNCFQGAMSARCWIMSRLFRPR